MVARTQVEAYERDGYVVCPGWLDGSVVERCRAELGATCRPGPVVAVPAGTRPDLDSLVAASPLTGLAASLLGCSEVRCFGCTFMVKAPLVGPAADWHQDGHPWATGLAITSAVTLWLALDPARPGNGAVQVIPGSHSLAAQPLRPGGGMFGSGIDPDLVDQSKVITLEMDPGDVSAHHPCLIHGSGPNRSTQPRRALAIRYTPA
jgi:ectoine hydroxylase-related dioxygenase (phytanoyl-CoA dioxygenase family)